MPKHNLDIPDYYLYYCSKVARQPTLVFLEYPEIVKNVHLLSMNNNGIDIDLLLIKAYQVLRDYQQVGTHLNKLVKDIYSQLYARNYDNDMLMTGLVSFEQCVLKLRDDLMNIGLYIDDRIMTYSYENKLEGRTFVLKNVENYEDFCDAFADILTN